MSKQDDHLNEQLMRYQQGQFNVLMPTKQLLELNEFFRPVLEEVTLSYEAGDAYPMESAWKPEKCNKWGLSKNGLLKLMSCAGIMIDPVKSRRLDNGSDKMYCSFQVVGALKKADGSLFPMKGSAEVDIEVLTEEIRDNKWAMAEKLDRKGGQDAPPWGDLKGQGS